MRRVRILMLGLLMPLTGCNLFYYAGKNLIQEPAERIDELQLNRRMRHEAEATWQQVCQQYDSRNFTREFADGFVEGYFDYLDHGGMSMPPTVPPPRYRRTAYLTPSGYERAKDYLIGFKYGADVAQQSGRRHFHTIPVLLPEAATEPPLNIVQLPEGEAFPAPPPASDFKGVTPPSVALPKPTTAPSPVAPPASPMPPSGEGSRLLPSPRPIDEATKPVGIPSVPAPPLPTAPTVVIPLPAEVLPSGGPIPGVDDIIQAIELSESPSPVLELPIRGPRGFDAQYLAPTLWLVGDSATGL